MCVNFDGYSDQIEIVLCRTKPWFISADYALDFMILYKISTPASLQIRLSFVSYFSKEKRPSSQINVSFFSTQNEKVTAISSASLSCLTPLNIRLSPTGSRLPRWASCQARTTEALFCRTGSSTRRHHLVMPIFKIALALLPTISWPLWKVCVLLSETDSPKSTLGDSILLTSKYVSTARDRKGSSILIQRLWIGHSRLWAEVIFGIRSGACVTSR